MTENQALSLRTKMLGALVREARMEAGKSIRDSAEMLGISPSTFSSYEHGRQGISLPELEILCF
ncbi:MAG: helix-turn-helix domain-containing protein, partial [Anaerolineales bacterium]